MDGNKLLRDQMLTRLGLDPQQKPAPVVQAKDHSMWVTGNDELIPIRWMSSHHIQGAIDRLKAHPGQFFKGLDKAEYLNIFARELQKRDVAAHRLLNTFTKYREYERGYRNRKKDINPINKSKKKYSRTFAAA